MKETKCELCGEPMPPGEEMFMYHGYSGPCPKPMITNFPTRTEYSDRSLGIYHKFTVIRNDGASSPGRKHAGCRYFVLDIDHDKFAIPALKAYADACKSEYPALSSDLEKLTEGK